MNVLCLAVPLRPSRSSSILQIHLLPVAPSSPPPQPFFAFLLPFLCSPPSPCLNLKNIHSEWCGLVPDEQCLIIIKLYPTQDSNVSKWSIVLYEMGMCQKSLFYILYCSQIFEQIESRKISMTRKIGVSFVEVFKSSPIVVKYVLYLIFINYCYLD